MQTNYFLVGYTIIFYYTIIVGIRVLYISSFAVNSGSFVFLFKDKKLTKFYSSKKRKDPPPQKKTISSQKKKEKKKPPNFFQQLSQLLKELWHKQKPLNLPKKTPSFIILAISIYSYFTSFSIETLIITYLYLSGIYLVFLIYLAYLETKEENERLKRKLRLQEKNKRRKKRLTTKKKTNKK